MVLRGFSFINIFDIHSKVAEIYLGNRNESKKIIFTGGGSAGHVTLNVSLIPLFQKDGWNVSYIGSINGIEKDIIANLDNVSYYPIRTGKLRRYFSWKNFSDFFNIPIGIVQAFKIIKQENPDVIFAKGGFVSFPVVLAAWLLKKKIFMHESDLTPGLANKLALPFISNLFTTFVETKNFINRSSVSKIEYVGPIISDRLKNGNKDSALKLCGFASNKPIILIMGGSLGAQSINTAIRKNLAFLLNKYQIIHLCGKGQLDKQIAEQGYCQFEYVDKGLKDFMAAADVVISRAGSNSIFEILSLQKPMILVPLPQTSSRGEQSLNAKVFKQNGFGEIITDEELLSENKLISTLDKVYENRNSYIQNMKNSNIKLSDIRYLFDKINFLAFQSQQKL